MFSDSESDTYAVQCAQIWLKKRLSQPSVHRQRRSPSIARRKRLQLDISDSARKSTVLSERTNIAHLRKYKPSTSDTHILLLPPPKEATILAVRQESDNGLLTPPDSPHSIVGSLSIVQYSHDEEVFRLKTQLLHLAADTFQAIQQEDRSDATALLYQVLQWIESVPYAIRPRAGRRVNKPMSKQTLYMLMLSQFLFILLLRASDEFNPSDPNDDCNARLETAAWLLLWYFEEWSLHHYADGIPFPWNQEPNTPYLWEKDDLYDWSNVWGQYRRSLVMMAVLAESVFLEQRVYGRPGPFVQMGHSSQTHINRARRIMKDLGSVGVGARDDGVDGIANMMLETTEPYMSLQNLQTAADVQVQPPTLTTEGILYTALAIISSTTPPSVQEIHTSTVSCFSDSEPELVLSGRYLPSPQSSTSSEDDTPMVSDASTASPANDRVYDWAFTFHDWVRVLNAF